jgi:ketosteroid isomerase-like protein
VASSKEEIVRRLIEVVNTAKSVDEAIATGIEDSWHPDIEYVNPDDAIERGTRRGAEGMRTALQNLIEGAGAGVTFELEELAERGDRVFTSGRIHARGPSGAQAVGPLLGTIYTFRGGRLLRIEWHREDLDQARANFEQAE